MISSLNQQQQQKPLTPSLSQERKNVNNNTVTSSPRFALCRNNCEGFKKENDSN